MFGKRTSIGENRRNDRAFLMEIPRNSVHAELDPGSPIEERALIKLPGMRWTAVREALQRLIRGNSARRGSHREFPVTGTTSVDLAKPVKFQTNFEDLFCVSRRTESRANQPRHRNFQLVKGAGL